MKIEKTVSLHAVEASDLSEIQNQLIARAKAAAARAYAPFSEFQVGCAVLLDNGTIVEGNNQENAAFPSGLCAERVALFYAGAQFPEARVNMLAVTAISSKYEVPELLCPCGACLQVMAETEKRSGNKMDILLHSHLRTYLANGVEQFLPYSFKLIQKDG